MNWRRLYATVQVWCAIGLFAFIGAGSSSFVIAGLCRLAFHWRENVAMPLIGFPLFAILFVVFARGALTPLRKAGMLSDDPEKFGPWFKDRRD
jgi:hypothetical protein